MGDAIDELSSTIKRAAQTRTPLAIRGGGTKEFYGDFYGEPIRGELLDTRNLSGIVAYEPGELVITARGGTPLAEIEAAMAGARQMLGFEPPHFGAGATLGGAVAAGLSGPRRPYAGAVRDAVLGVRVLNGRGEELRFGGNVIKNVAGYDISRLMVGALGTLGVLTEISLRVLPLPVAETTLRFEMTEARATEAVNRWAGAALPLSATCFLDGVLSVRLSGASAAVEAAKAKLGGEVGATHALWNSIREQIADFFHRRPLWRVSVPPTSAPLETGLPQLIEWGGGLRWLTGELDAQALRERVAALGGHLTLFRSGDRPATGVFHPLPANLMTIHRRLKAVFDPDGILNPGRMYRDL